MLKLETDLNGPGQYRLYYIVKKPQLRQPNHNFKISQIENFSKKNHVVKILISDHKWYFASVLYQIIHVTLETAVCQIIVQLTLVLFDPVFTFFDLTFFVL